MVTYLQSNWLPSQWAHYSVLSLGLCGRSRRGQATNAANPEAAVRELREAHDKGVRDAPGPVAVLPWLKLILWIRVLRHQTHSHLQPPGAAHSARQPPGMVYVTPAGTVRQGFQRTRLISGDHAAGLGGRACQNPRRTSIPAMSPLLSSLVRGLTSVTKISFRLVVF